MSTRQAALISLLSESLADPAFSNAPLSLNARFDDLGLDSLDLTEFFLRVESTFGVTFDRRDVSGFVSLASLDSFLATREAIR